MKKTLQIATLLAGVIQNLPASAYESILAVSECKPYQTILTTFGMGMDYGSYTNFSLVIKTCNYDSDKKRYAIKMKATIIDLGFFDDNDNEMVTQNLRAQCEVLRELKAGKIIPLEQSLCRDSMRVR